MMVDEPPAGRIEVELDLPPGQEPEEDVLSKKQINSPSRMGVEIPTGWKPTVKEPVPVVRCQYVWKDPHPRAGERCDRWSLRGSLLCHPHSGRGNLKNVEIYRKAIIEAARLKLTESVPDALDVVLDLMANSGADAVRLKAAESVMDRGGLKAIEQMNIAVEVTDGSPTETLQGRLQKLRVAAEQVQNLQHRQRPKPEPDLPEQLAIEGSFAVIDTGAEVIEGEIVEEPE